VPGTHTAKADLFRVLGHPVRVRILDLLRDGRVQVRPLIDRVFPLDEAAAREIQAGIDSFFKGLSSPGVKVDDRVAALYQLYGILVLLRCGDLLQRLK